MKCWKCGIAQDNLPKDNLSFRAICEKCGTWLHCCKNCKNYQPGKPNDCLIPGTEYIADREASNFCEEFKLLGTGPQKTLDPKEAIKHLFKDEEPKKEKPHPKNPFDSLFN